MSPSPEVQAEIRQCSQALQDYFVSLHNENERLLRENAELRARLNQNSTNSSKPPSSDRFVKPKSLREKTGRKPGGQPGHKGTTLRRTETPDAVIEHPVHACSHCGSNVTESDVTGYKARQVVDVKIVRVVTEHRATVANCLVCGQQTMAEFPPGVEHYLQYGPVHHAIMVCLHGGHHIPYGRLAQISKDILGIPVSSGTLVTMVNKCGHTVKKSLATIKEQLQQAGTLNVDETGVRVMGENRWLHTACNDR